KTAKQPTFKDAADGGIPYTTPNSGNDRVVRNVMLEKDGWNDVEIVLQGDCATHIVNGKVNMKISKVAHADPDKPGEMVAVKRGKILFQAEGAEVMFRNIDICPLSATATISPGLSGSAWATLLIFMLTLPLTMWVAQ